jgi:hypothetical protein
MHARSHAPAACARVPVYTAVYSCTAVLNLVRLVRTIVLKYTACGNQCIFNPGQHVDLRFLTGISYLKKVPATSDLLKFVLGRQAINLV